jgi:hypothetical protein
MSGAHLNSAQAHQTAVEAARGAPPSAQPSIDPGISQGQPQPMPKLPAGPPPVGPQLPFAQ